MSQSSREFLEAVNKIVENKHPSAEWDGEEMRKALVEKEEGATYDEACEGRDFDKGSLQHQMERVREKEKEIVAQREEGSGLFEDPIEEAKSEFRSFFDEMNKKYNMGVNDVTVQMMVDEIDDSRQLPRPPYVSQFLETTSSGVANAGDLRYITRRYRQWLERYREEMSGSGQAMPSGGVGGPSIGGGNQQPQGQQGGVSVGGGAGLFPDNQQQQQQQGGDRVDRLEREIQELKEMMADDQSSSGGGGQITIETKDGREVTVPADHPRVQQMMGGGGSGGGDDFMEMLEKAKNAGLVAGPEDLRAMQDSGSDFEEMFERMAKMGVIDTGGDEELVSAIQQSIESLGQKQLQAQQQMSQNFNEAIESLRAMQEDDDEELSRDDVAQIIEDKLTKDETERLREEMDEKFEQVMDEVKDSRRRRTPPSEDPEVKKLDREMQFREKQLDTVSDNLETAATELKQLGQTTLLPAIRELGKQEQQQNQPIWEPPEEPQREQPARDPQRPVEQPAAAPEPEPAVEDTDQGLAQEEPQGVTHEDAVAVREKLPIETDGSGDDSEQ